MIIREDFVKAGYSWMDVDVRGTGASFGRRTYQLSTEEVRDGADLIDWIVDQPWSAGVVGAMGSSYDGMLATMLLRNSTRRTSTSRACWRVSSIATTPIGWAQR